MRGKILDEEFSGGPSAPLGAEGASPREDICAERMVAGGQGQGPLILWSRRDLRLSDHPMLAAARATGRPLVPVFVLDP